MIRAKTLSNILQKLQDISDEIEDESLNEEDLSLSAELESLVERIREVRSDLEIYGESSS